MSSNSRQIHSLPWRKRRRWDESAACAARSPPDRLPWPGLGDLAMSRTRTEGDKTKVELVQSQVDHRIGTETDPRPLSEPLPRPKRQRRRAKSDRGLPPDQQLTALAVEYLQTQHKLWPKIAAAGLLQDGDEP